MTPYILKLRTKEYRISTDTVVHDDGSRSNLVFCNGRVITHPTLCDLPKTVVKALRREMESFS